MFIQSTNQSVIDNSFEKKAFAAATRLKAKFSKYKNETFYNNTIFTPLIFEEFGLWHPTTKELIHTICRRIAHRSHQSIDQIKYYYSKILTAQLTRINSDMILSHCDSVGNVSSGQLFYNRR